MPPLRGAHHMVQSRGMPESPVPPSVAAFLPADLPSPLKALAGIAITMVHDVRQLPERATQLPGSVVTRIAAKSLRVQQQYAEWVARGEQFLSALQEPSEEIPAWATFDEDLPAPQSVNANDAPAPVGLGPGSAFDLQSDDDLPVARRSSARAFVPGENAAAPVKDPAAPVPAKKPAPAKKSAPAKKQPAAKAAAARKPAAAKKQAAAKKTAPATKSSPARKSGPAKSAGSAAETTAPATDAVAATDAVTASTAAIGTDTDGLVAAALGSAALTAAQPADGGTTTDSGAGADRGRNADTGTDAAADRGASPTAPDTTRPIGTALADPVTAGAGDPAGASDPASDPVGAPNRTAAAAGSAGTAGSAGSGETAAPQSLPDFDTLTIPQLRTRLKTLRSPELGELIAYEEAGRNRPAVVGMLRARLDTLQK